MRILWIHQYFATPKGWGAVRTYEFARRFVKAGHAVDVVCCASYDGSLGEARREPLELDGMRVFVSGTSYRPHMGFARRVWSFLRFMGSALWTVLTRGGHYDVCIASSGPLTVAVPALAGRALRGLPFVFEVIDVWPDSAIAAGVLRNPVLKRLSFLLEAFAYRYASAIVTCSTGMTERVRQKLDAAKRGAGDPRQETAERVSGKPGLSKVVTLSNSCDLELFVPDAQKRREARERLGVRDGQTVVLYTGAMGLSNQIGDLVAAVQATAAEERVVWWFAGDGPYAGPLKRLAEGGGGRSRFFGTMPKEELVALYLAADLNIVTFMHEPLFYENSPNKFFDGIAAGLPAIFNRSTWLEPWLEQYGCGAVCKSDSPAREMADVICSLAGDRERLRKMGDGARRLAEEVFSRDALSAEYLSVLGQVVR